MSPSILVRAVAVVSLGSAVMGCQKSNDATRQDVDRGSGYIAAGAADEAVKKLTPGAALTLESGASIHAKAALGHAKLDLAFSKANELTSLYTEIAQLQSEAAQVANIVANGNVLIEGYKLANPAAAHAKIQGLLSEAEGGEGKAVWFDTGKLPLPTLSAAKESVSKSEAAVAAKEAEIKKLEGDRTAALAKADELATAVDGAKGRAAVDAFAKASEARKDVSAISTSIDVAQNDLALLHADLAIATGQVETVSRYIAGLKDEDKSIAAGFDAIKSQVAAQSKVSTLAVTGGGKDNSSIDAKAAELAEKLKQADEVYGEAQKLFGEAATEYRGAFSEAQLFRKGLEDQIQAGSTKDQDVVVMLVKLTEKTTLPAVYKLDLGQALAGTASLEASKATLLASRAAVAGTVSAALGKAGIAVPAALEVKAGDVKASKDAAVKAFADADLEFENAYNGIQGGDPLSVGRQNNITLARLFLNYSLSQFLASTGDTAGAADALKKAAGYRDTLLGSNFAIPGLPPELQVAPVAPAAPTTAPTAGGTPAGDATPTTGPTSAPSTEPTTVP